MSLPIILLPIYRPKTAWPHILEHSLHQYNSHYHYILSILTHIAAHSSSSGHTYPTHSPLFRPLIFGIASVALPFHHTYLKYPHANSTIEHILLTLFASTAHPTMSHLVHLVNVAVPYTCHSYSPCSVTVLRGKIKNSALDRFLIKWIHTYGGTT